MQTRTVIFNLSGAYDQMGMTRCEGVFAGSDIISLSSLEGTGCYCDDEAAAAIRSAVAKESLDGSSRAVCWIDSGDYHYMSLFRAERISRPFQLLLVDRHPDMQEPVFGDVISCGGWLRLLLEANPNLLNVVIVGMNPELAGETEGFPQRLSGALRDDLPVFLSIDKDALSQDESRTNWDQGDMTFGQLADVVSEAVSGREVLGVDICGEKHSSKGGDAQDRRLNMDLNCRIQSLMESLLG